MNESELAMSTRALKLESGIVDAASACCSRVRWTTTWHAGRVCGEKSGDFRIAKDR